MVERASERASLTTARPATDVDFDKLIAESEADRDDPDEQQVVRVSVCVFCLFVCLSDSNEDVATGNTRSRADFV